MNRAQRVAQRRVWRIVRHALLCAALTVGGIATVTAGYALGMLVRALIGP